jgi:hypothetical protein
VTETTRPAKHRALILCRKASADTADLFTFVLALRNQRKREIKYPFFLKRTNEEKIIKLS